MNILRIILIITGIIFIIGIYYFQKKIDSSVPFLQNIKIFLKKLFTPESESVREPSSIKHSVEQLSKEQLASMSNMVANKVRQNEVTAKDVSIEAAQTQAVVVPKGEELLITLTVIPKSGHCFSGNEIISACQSAGLQLGEFNIFHRYALVNDKVQIIPVCSLVNLFEPGYFDMDTMLDFSTEGLSLFMQLPGPVDGREAFSILMDVSEKLSLNLNATICDDSRSVLTTQTISHLKEKVENYCFKLKMASLQNH